MKICLNLKSSLQPNPLSPWERARERAANQRFAWVAFSTCRLLFTSLKPRFSFTETPLPSEAPFSDDLSVFSAQAL
ncbi:hypothetical protein A6J88_13935 [Neisseria mucosa]|uniref:Uncharacterized protein n=1 Tax=Neisseria mucosa TaxID=488 RepID=A0ABM6T468_NEIMU|nr:hypothetical protein A6J88_13935 [Neisseria mucosa]